MTRRHRSRRSIWIAAALVAVIALAIPTVGTLAQLTSQKTSTATVTTGDWCAMPDARAKRNVYKLSDFATVSAPEKNGSSTAVRMLVLPVANDGSYAPAAPLSSSIGAAQNQLGIRLWSCNDPVHTTGNLKVSAWRGDYAQNAFSWTAAPTTGSFASARLSAAGTPVQDAATTSSTNPGMELRDLHRSQDALGGSLVNGTDPVTGRYSWLLTSGRSKTATAADPSCAIASCRLTAGSGVAGFSTVFSADPATAASGGVSGNSVTYLAEKYYAYGEHTVKVCTERLWLGWTWSEVDLPESQCTDSLFYDRELESQTVTGSAVTTASNGTVTAKPTTIAAAGGASADSLVRDVTGTKLQWVVIEWWGTQAPGDLEIEVFVAGS